MMKWIFRGEGELATTLRTFRREFASVALFSAVTNLLMLVPTIYLLQVFDRVLMSRNELTLLMVSLLMLFLLVVMGFTDWSRSRLLVRTGVRLDQALSTRVFDAGFDGRRSTASLSSNRPFSDLIELRQFMTGTGALTFFDLPWTLIFLAVLFVLHPLLGWVAVGFVVLQSLYAFSAQRVTARPTLEAQDAQSDSVQFLQGKLRHADVVHALGLWSPLVARWKDRHAQGQRLHEHAHHLSQAAAAGSKWLRYAHQSMGLAAGAYLVIQGELTAGAMIAANVLMTRTLAPIDQLASTWKQVHSARHAYGRLAELLQAHPPTDPALGRTRPSGRVDLRKVVAQAPGREAPILASVDLTMAPGMVTVLVGPSGSGKSTLARVVLGIWPATSGEVLLDGRPVADWSRDELGPHLGYLPQDVELFEGTVAENIARMGQVDADAVVKAAKATGMHEDILRMPGGYDSQIGVGGQVLSGGQRQRIALARAVYGQPVLLVLDEPNASLDDAGERALEQTVHALKAEGSTLLLITHRPALLALADQLVVMRDGRIIHAGARDDVLQALRMAAQPSSAPLSESSSKHV
jgi:ATP-binding cassette, subfamily C, bacterial exporter for protease/lipase